jgi:nitroimidazol reductase NimA-like FMN-containing flavoprotein (pyridoxamine 5'-phosphate oxidase superfamily)
MPKYHLKRKDKEITSQADMQAIIKRGQYTVVALCHNDEPYLVTMNYGYDEKKNALYFHAALEGQKLEFIEHNPNACATIIEDLGYKQGECSHSYRTVVIRGRMAIVDNLDEKKHGLNILIDHLEQSPAETKLKFLKNDLTYDTVTVLRLDIEDITGKQGV